jgi:hypothetical protein
LFSSLGLNANAPMVETAQRTKAASSALCTVSFLPPLLVCTGSAKADWDALFLQCQNDLMPAGGTTVRLVAATCVAKRTQVAGASGEFDYRLLRQLVTYQRNIAT